MMDCMRWKRGWLLAFSAFDGRTEYHTDLVMRSGENPCSLAVAAPVPGGRLVPGNGVSARAEFAGDHFSMTDSDGSTVQGAMPDAFHLLVRGKCSAEGSALTRSRRVDLWLFGVRERFDARWLESDFDAVYEARGAWLRALPLPEALPELRRSALQKACTQLKTQLNSPCGGLTRRWTTPDRWPHKRMWLWDSAFHAIALRWLDGAAARESLLAVFDRQAGNGFVPHMGAPDAASAVTQPPVLAFGAAKLLEKENDRAFLEEFYPKNRAFLHWLETHRDTDGGGLLEWLVEEKEHCRCGESGMDNSPRFDGRTVPLDAPDFNAYYSHECELMADFAGRLNLPEEAADWRSRHETVNRRIRERLWSETHGLFMDCDAATGKISEVESSAGFLPLLCGAATPEQAQCLARQLRDTDGFGTAFPAPSLPVRDKIFYRKDMWRGPVWININYLIAEGFARYGMTAEADGLRLRSVTEMEKQYERYGTFFEFYDDRGEKDPPELERKNRCDPGNPYHQAIMDYGWSAALYADWIFSGVGETVKTQGGIR